MLFRRLFWPAAWAATCLATAAPAARAGGGWMVSIEAPGAFPLSSPQRDRFEPGGMPAAGLYHTAGHKLLFGLRLRGGILLNGPAPKNPLLMDPGTGGLGSLDIGVRIRPLAQAAAAPGDGLWLEVAGGAAVTGTDIRPTLEIGAGWGFAVGAVGIGPTLRYLEVHQMSGSLDGRDARLALVGVEFSFGGSRRAAAPIPVATTGTRTAPPLTGDSDGDLIPDDEDACPNQPEDRDMFQDNDGCPDPDNDGDGIPDRLDACPNRPETVNGIDDQDGCPDKGLIVLIKDRITLDQRVLFDKDRARVKHEARPILRAIIKLWSEHPEWKKMRIEGFADQRGPADWNLKLSRMRANRVRNELIKLGMDPRVLETRGFGATHLLDRGTTKAAYQRNRRVEFVMIKEQPKRVEAPAPAGAGPAARALP